MPTLTLSPPTTAIAPVGVSITVTVVGSGTAFTGSPFTLTGGAADTILLAQSVTDGTHATLTIGVGMTAGTLTVTDTGSSSAASIVTSNPAGYYCNLVGLYQQFGPQNIAVWSNMGGTPNGAVDVSNVLAALQYADAEINNFFANGPYAVPLVAGSSASTVGNWAAVIAGSQLYTRRGQLDTVVNSDGSTRMVNKYLGALRSVYTDMGLYKSGYKTLIGPSRVPNMPSGPVVVVV